MDILRGRGIHFVDVGYTRALTRCPHPVQRLLIARVWSCSMKTPTGHYGMVIPETTGYPIELRFKRFALLLSVPAVPHLIAGPAVGLNTVASLVEK